MESQKFNKIIAVVIWYNPTNIEANKVKLYMKDVDSIIVVDNSKNDNIALINGINNIYYLPQKDNLGIAKALNIGCEKAKELGADWVLTMDQDSTWNQHSVTDYIKMAANYPKFDKVAIFSPFHDCDGHPQTHKTKGIYENKKVIMCSGNLLRISAWQQANGFREDFFIDSVDDEICCHLRQFGWEIVRINNIYLTHALGNGVQDVPLIHHPYVAHTAWRYYYIARNMRRMIQMYPDMAKYYKKSMRKYIKRLWLYDWDDKFAKLKELHRGWFDGNISDK